MQNDKHICDEELLHRIKRDDPHALRMLFERHFSALCHFSFKFVKTSNLAEEAVSDVFLNIWLNRKKIEIKANLKVYLFTAVRNQSINYLKQQKMSFEDIGIAEKENKISDLHADRLVVYKELQDDIDALIQKMPNKRQIIFRLNRIDGLSYKEIAEILGITETNVATKISRIKNKLKQKILNFNN